MERRENFFNQNLGEWLVENLDDSSDLCGGSWSIFFGVACWLLWKWRNKKIFDPNFVMPSDPLKVVEWWVGMILRAYEKEGKGRMSGAGNEEIHIRWWPPERDWVKVNTDATFDKDTGLMACGGLVRDSDGRWLGGFSKNLSKGSIFEAEIWGILEGIKLVWDLGFRKVVVEADSLGAINLCDNIVDSLSARRLLLMEIQRWKMKEWRIVFRHQFREGNRATDCLAGLSRVIQEGRVRWLDPPECLGRILREDSLGVFLPRGF